MSEYGPGHQGCCPSPWKAFCLTPAGKLRAGAIILAGFLIACLYVPTIASNFDFADDGLTAHPAGDPTFWYFNYRVWAETYGEFVGKGPFRPVATYFWNGQQELLNGNSLYWRSFRFLWTVLSACMFLWFLQEVGFTPGVSLFTMAAAMWNPYRAEVWISLTYCEGIALPFAIGGLICAYRAARSERPWLWDVGAMTGALLAFGCKNVFAAVIPVQMFLRVCHPELTLWEGVKRYGWRACLLGLVLIFPVTHFICYRLTATTSSYALAWDPRQPVRFLNCLLGGIGKDFFGPAIAAAAVLSGWAWLRGRSTPQTDSRSDSHADAVVAHGLDVRAAFGAGVVLFLLGWGMYCPLTGVAGRYTFPAVWGLDLLCALLWTRLTNLPGICRKITYGLLACGLALTVASNIGKQEKTKVRLDVLWNALTYVQQNLPTGSRVAWLGVADKVKSDELEFSEALHFRWHLRGVGRSDLRWLDDEDLQNPMMSASEQPEYLIASSILPPGDGHWRLLQECRGSYWAVSGRKQVLCCVWQRTGASAP